MLISSLFESAQHGLLTHLTKGYDKLNQSNNRVGLFPLPFGMWEADMDHTVIKCSGHLHSI